MTEQPRGRGVEDHAAVREALRESDAGELKAALDQRNALLHELDHRVKNNLQLISSLMLMQVRRTKDPAVREALEAMHGRLSALGVVHRRLFQSNEVEVFDLSAFVRDLAAELSGPSGRRDIHIDCDLQPAPVPASQAAPIALLINELLSNAFRHAFPPGRPGRLSITIVKFAADLRIEIADNGVGRAQGDQDDEQGFGLTIVELLARQLQARIERVDAHPGVRVTVSLPTRR